MPGWGVLVGMHPAFPCLSFLVTFLSVGCSFSRRSELQDGVTWSQLDAASSSLASGPNVVLASGRVLDALDGSPVVGATVEFWTEDDAEPRRRTHVETTEVDGAFLLCAARSDPSPVVGEKLVVHAPGYTSTGGDRGGEEEFFLFPQAEPLRLRCVDVDGQPISGVQVRSRHSCAHDAPAVRGPTGQHNAINA